MVILANTVVFGANTLVLADTVVFGGKYSVIWGNYSGV